ncbi:MAG: ThiF family adenylyltransferase [Bacteroidales bacterium]|nr:ThiF family adenylyltransferase [Bacteroidales bacterium]
MNIEEDKLRDARIMVVGCGALGNEVLKNLVLLGVGHLVVVDFDVVEQGNLTRSILFRPVDVGRRKVDVVKDALRGINATVDVQAIHGDVAYDVGLALIRQMNVVMGCVDSRWTRYCIQRLCTRAGKTWIDGGIIGMEGTMRVFVPGVNCYACGLGTEGLDELRRRMPCSGVIRQMEAAGHAPTTSVAASVIGAWQAAEALKVIAGVPVERNMCYYDGENLSVRKAVFEAWDDDCVLHEQWEPIEVVREHSLKSLLRIGTVVLNDAFVDYVENRETGEQTEAMLPARRMAGFVKQHPRLSTIPMAKLCQHEYAEIDTSFPYPTLPLAALGIPAHDIVRIKTPTGYRYVEL